MEQKEKIYGIHSILEALNEGVTLNKVYIQKDLHNERIKEVIQRLKKAEIPFQMVPKEKLNRLTSKAHQGLIAFTSPTEFYTVEQLIPGLYEQGKIPFLAVLCGITDVRNFGAIARSAECMGVDALVIPAQGSAMINPDAIKTSAGALHKLPVCREINFLRAIKFIRDSGIDLVACTEKADLNIADIDLNAPIAVLLGSEGSGIEENLLDLCQSKARIPMKGEIQSMNVSVAAGIIFYETLKQRRLAE
jgi:23S rRNA (guanosine2251-2'-O)-methyltransferase